MGDTGIVAPAITLIGSIGIAYITARGTDRASRRQEQTKRELAHINTAAETEQIDAGARAKIETEAFQRAQAYLNDALDDARAELDDERREHREDVTRLREEVRDLTAIGREAERQLTEEKAAHRRTRSILRAMARRTGEPLDDGDG